MRALIWDILIPGGLAQRRKRKLLLKEVVDETLDASGLDPHPLARVLTSEERFRTLVADARTIIGEGDSALSPTDIVQEIRERGYEPKPPEPKKQTKSKIPTTVVLGVIAAFVLLRGKDKQI